MQFKVCHLRYQILIRRTLILLCLTYHIRSLGSVKIESKDHRNSRYLTRSSNNNNQPLSPSPVNLEGDEESSSENSLRAHKRNSNTNNAALVRAISSKPSRNSIRSSSNHQVSSSRTDVPSAGCPTCTSSLQNQEIIESSEMPDETLRKMRLEMIKQQILRKLRLKEPPNVPKLPRDLPIPVTLGETLNRKNNENFADKDVEDFYGKTEQIIAFPEETSFHCTGFEVRHPSTCFRFKLPSEIRFDEIESVELWAFKLPDPNDITHNQTFFVSHIDQSKRVRLIDTKSNLKMEQGWFKMNLTSPSIHWLRTKEYDHILQIGCKTCVQAEDNKEPWYPIGTEGEERPFIVFNMGGIVKKKRSRRNIICSPGVKECCRERFVVNFKEIGWDWIIGPESYEAYFCKGSCMGTNSIATSASRRNSLIGAYVNSYRGYRNNRTQELIPCCTATRMSSISLIYIDRGDSNSTRTRTETLPNMVVESCGCL